jgi:subtilase family serine protease
MKKIHLRVRFIIICSSIPFIYLISPTSVRAASVTFETYEARPPIHALSGTTDAPRGLSPAFIKAAYHLPGTGGHGTIAIITAYHHPDIERDLASFSKSFSLASCTIQNKCLEIHPMNVNTKENSGWSLETALDSEWSHAVAPKAKILVVEAASASGTHLIQAIDYATRRKDVVSVSMSWGGDEFPTETKLDQHFTTSVTHPVAFFASSGDNGNGPSWPAVSPLVVAVGGTSLHLNSSGKFVSETAWDGSGGGVSTYEDQPEYQKSYSIPRAGGKRAIPDISYAADPQHGFSVYHKNGWYVIGGTSAGAPQWAAIASLGASLKHALWPTELYMDKAGALSAKYFRDITSGTNGSCTYYCSARKHYDYVTGLGSPVTYKF